MLPLLSAIADQTLFVFVSRFCLFCAFTRPTYQVSIYRTIGPLVYQFTAEKIPKYLYTSQNRTSLSAFVNLKNYGENKVI